MLEATRSLSRNNPSFYIAGAAVTLALMRASQAVKDAIRRMGAGDTLIVWKLDRLARSTRDLLNTLAAIAEAGASTWIGSLCLQRNWSDLSLT
jgi:Resolvase, N terminal domain